MQGDPPPPEDARDTEHLRLLVTFHYVWAVLAGIGGCGLGGFMLLVVVMMNRAAAAGQTAGATPGGTNQGPPPEMMEMFGWMYGAMGVLYLLGGVTLSVLAYLTARNLAARRRRTFCLVASAAQCLAVPFGTAIGIFTILVLSRVPVVRRFEAGAAR